MKIILIISCIILITGLGYFFYLGHQSRSGNALGLKDNKLYMCSKKPNCICSEFQQDTSHYTSPINFSETSIEKIQQQLINTIKYTGGKVVHNEKNYIAATYTSMIFGYVDDFELRIDQDKQLIHIRSASRVGHSDMGVNLKRTKRFKDHFKALSE